MKQVFYLTFIISLSLTVYFLILIFRFQEKLYNRILELEKRNKIQQLRSIIETQETSIKNIVEELRDNIYQTLAASRFFLEEATISGDNRELVSKSYALTDEAMNALTMLCIKIHPAVITDLGLIEGIQEYILELKKISRTEINLAYNDPGIEEINDHDKISIFRIIQDYLILVLKNPATSLVRIGISYKHPLLKLTLTQNDPGFDFMKDSLANNLASINNRITYFNGTIRQKTEGLFETSVVELHLN
jgi:signal transduction histidine kinase